MDEGGVLVSVRADFHQREAGAVSAEAILENDQRDEDERGADGDQGRGDEQAVAAARLCEDEKVHRPYEDAEGEEDDDEEDVVERFFAKGFLQRPCGIEVSGDGGEAVLGGAIDVGKIDRVFAIEAEVGLDGFDEGFAETGIFG